MIEILRNQAKEIADAGINGWGNTMIEAADTIESMRQQLASRDAEIAELVAALQMAFDYAIRGKTFPANAQTTALLNAVEIELAKVRKP